MLTIIVLGDEVFDDETEEFSTVNDVVLELEHSLLSLSKWESFYEKPFLSKDEKTPEEIIYYIKCMTNTENYPGDVFSRLSSKNLLEIHNHLEAKMSATWFSEQRSVGPAEVITAELIYYWMFSSGIPIECERWHLNKLFTLIKIVGIKNSKETKMSNRELADRNRALNAKRKAQLGTSG